MWSILSWKNWISPSPCLFMTWVQNISIIHAYIVVKTFFKVLNNLLCLVIAFMIHSRKSKYILKLILLTKQKHTLFKQVYYPINSIQHCTTKVQQVTHLMLFQLHTFSVYSIYNLPSKMFITFVYNQSHNCSEMKWCENLWKTF